MPNYPADPGGVFATDAHRRVLGHLPLPGDPATEVNDLLQRMAPDGATAFTETDELEAVLDELRDDGDASQLKAGTWRMTKAGFNKLIGANDGE